MGWKLVFSFFFSALLLGYGSVEVRSDQSSSGRFSKDGQGIIKDKRTGLQWYMGPESDTNWYQAQSWVQSLSVGGGGWRLPTRSELAGLSAKQSDGSYLEPIFSYKSRIPFVWSGESTDSSSAWDFDFSHGEEYWNSRKSSLGGRAFAVRSR